jgi:hypothetical protein
MGVAAVLFVLFVPFVVILRASERSPCLKSWAAASMVMADFS